MLRQWTGPKSLTMYRRHNSNQIPTLQLPQYHFRLHTQPLAAPPQYSVCWGIRCRVWVPHRAAV